MRRFLPAIIAAAAVCYAPFGAAAQSACVTFEVYAHPDDREATYVDNGDDGLSTGDQRIGSRGLVDENGETVGRMRWVTTVLVPGDEPAESSQRVAEFASGRIFATAANSPTRPFEDASTMAITAESAIVGGTGVFSHAHGVIVFDQSDNSKFTFDMACD